MRVATKDEREVRKWKAVIVEVKPSSNGVVEETADHGNADSAAIWDYISSQKN